MYIMYLMYEKYVFLMLRQYGLRATSTRPSQLIPMSVHAMQTQGANPTYKKKKTPKEAFLWQLFMRSNFDLLMRFGT